MKLNFRLPLASEYILAIAPVCLFALFWQLRPFSCELACEKAMLRDLSANQKANIQTAAKRLNGVVLKPGQIFSFNGSVGPRTTERGYRGAAAYVGGSRLNTTGGGICLVSSAVYQAALKSGLLIVERHPHERPVSTVAPGLDATVWWGEADLKVKNTLSEPVKLILQADAREIAVSILGSRTARPVTMRRLEERPAPNLLVVEVSRDLGSGPSLVSRDLYRLCP